jgi:hypothetical protein
MLTAEPTIDKPLKPYETPTPAGWYDPDSAVFQAADDERAESDTVGRAEDDDVRSPALVAAGASTTRR